MVYKIIPILTLTLSLLLSCSFKTPVMIGFTGDLTGNSELATSGKNGVDLAIKEINLSGGIAGRPIELIAVNNYNNKEESYKATKELVKSGVSLIIGPFLSSMSQSVKMAAMASNTLVISPTVSTTSLSGSNDSFVKLTPDAINQGLAIANLINRKGGDRVLVIIDENNINYTLPGYNGVKQGLNTFNINHLVVADLSLMHSITSYITDYRPDSIVFFMDGLDTATIIDALPILDTFKPALYGSMWTKASGLLKYYSPKLEGMYVFDAFEKIKQSEAELRFRNKYFEEYGVSPSLGAKYGYEAIYLYKRAVLTRKSYETGAILETLKHFKVIEGLSDEYFFDENCDVVRSMSSFIISDGKYKLTD